MSEHGRIYALPLHLANQIAAGEVIERPASVLKELIENSLDAGADKIEIEIDSAGRKLIKVIDNGKGIHPDDLALALSRHATSKLHSSEQLSQIASLGFRGEALPSIASISELTLTSNQTGQPHGWQLSPNDKKAMPANHPAGTTIEVRDLFFNVPARRHFLRSDKTELNHITNTLYRLALSQFETGFHCKLTSSSKLNLPAATTPEQQQNRIAKICGKAFIENSLYLEQDYNDIKLHGWVGTADYHRPQTDIYYFFINGRVIRDRMINHAIRQAYSELIPSERYPAFVLYLTIPLELVDINVHPTKHEVRFRDARLIHGLINQAIVDAVGQGTDAEDNKQHTYSGNLATHSQPQPSVSEYSTPYLVKPTTSQQTKRVTGCFGKVHSLLSQRYLLIEQDAGLALLDLQKVELGLRQQQFKHAIQTNSLRSRPILVPLAITLEPEQLAKLKPQQRLLNEFGFQLQCTAQQLRLQAIPSLFANAHLPSLMKSIAEKIDRTTTSQKLSQILCQLLPLAPIQNLDQASAILHQLTKDELSPEYYKPLDELSLARLFDS